MSELGQRASEYLKDRFQVTSRFDAATALSTLERLGLVDDAALTDPDKAYAAVEAHWTTRDTTAHHLEAIERLAESDAEGG